MDKVEFHHSVRQGTILNIRCEKEREGRTSVSYKVEVYDRRNPHAPAIFGTLITYVSVDDAGRKRPLR